MRFLELCRIRLALLPVACFVMWSGAMLRGQEGRPGRVELAVGDGHGVLLKSDGAVWTWGDNNVGQLGRDGDDSWTPA